MEIIECKSNALFDEEGGLSEPEEASQKPVGPSFCPLCEESLQALSSRDRRDHVTSCLATRLAERKRDNKSKFGTNGLPWPKQKINVFAVLKANQKKKTKARKVVKKETKRSVKTILDFFANDEYFERKETRDKWSNLLYGKKKDRRIKNSLMFGKRKRQENIYRIPNFKRIIGTNIYVDAFTYEMPRNSIFFLSHFHSDHYRGLTRNFTQGPIYCSTITANLAREQFKIGSQLRELPMDKRMPVPGARPRTYVTLLDANHCPGAVMFIFEVYPGLKPFPDNQKAWQSRPEVVKKRRLKGIALFFKPTATANPSAVAKPKVTESLEPISAEIHASEAGRNKEISIHVGDFRALPEEMAGKNGSITRCLNGHRVQNLYLDTTYCGPQYTFPSQEEVLSYVEKYIKEILSKRGSSVLIYVGTYSIGKEKVLLRVSRASKRKIWVDRGKMKKLELLGLGDDLDRCFTTSYKSTQIRAAPLWALGHKFLKEILGKENDRFQTVIGIKPTGWSGKVKRRTRGAVQILSVPYSEHSNFIELKEFTQKLNPEVIIPTVNCGSQSQINRQVNMLKS